MVYCELTLYSNYAMTSNKNCLYENIYLPRIIVPNCGVIVDWKSSK